MLVLSSSLMALAWLGHLRFRDKWSFFAALAASWLIVLPEYILNVGATRAGHGIYTGAQMATIHLSGGVVFVAIVSKYVLGEAFGLRQGLGFVLLAVAVGLIMGERPS
jgi:uncharacterized protein (DUF486 family)